MDHFALFATIALTSIVSGILGMAGGLILKGALLLWIPVSSSMVIHGVIQMISNGSRAWTLRRKMVWMGIAPNILGSCFASAIFVAMPWVPSPSFVYLFLGLAPFVGFAVPTRWNLDLTSRLGAFSIGALTNAIQLVSGVGGPILDIAFLRSPLSKEQIVSTKALLQSLHHLIKSLTYAWVTRSTWQITAGQSASPMILDLVRFLTLAGLCSIGGTWIGTQILARIDDRLFRKIGRATIYAIGAFYLGSACVGLASR